jgi:hypothetical protein
MIYYSKIIFITNMIVRMIEPVTVSFGLYLLTSRPSIFTVNRKPLYLKKKLCRWIKKHSETMIDISVNEGSELIADNFNYLNHFNHLNSLNHLLNPSIYLILYLILCLYVIIF